MSNLLTNSRLRAYRECARLHRLLYEEGWRPVRESEAIRFGSLVHRGLEAWWGSDLPIENRWVDALAVIDGKAVDVFEAVRAEEILKGYQREWESRVGRYRTIAVEALFNSPLVNPVTGAASRTWALAGKVDAIVEDTATGQILLLEYKTTSDDLSAGSAYWAKLAMDTQVSHYIIGAERLGHEIHGVLYDVLRRPQLRPLRATPPKKRKYKKDGTLYANQRDADETPEAYRQRVRADISERPDRYYAQQAVARTESDLLDYLHDAWALGRQIREAELAGRAPRNPEACHRFGECAFWDVCAFGLRLEEHPDRFRRLEDVHPELEREETA